MGRFLELIRQGIPCLFYEVTGLYCPGCGGTRAVKALLRGDVAVSFHYHPVVVYTAVCLLVLLVTYGISRYLHTNKYRIYRYERFAYVGMGIVFINWGIKNYYLIVKGIDLLGNLK